MTNKLKAIAELLIAGLVGAGVMIVLKIISPNYGEHIFWIGFLILLFYFAYTYKVALLELEDFIKSLNKDKDKD
jgi:hypothetical protein